MKFTTYERALRRWLRIALRNLDLLAYPVEHDDPEERLRKVRQTLGKIQLHYDQPKARVVESCGGEWSEDDLALSPEGYTALADIFNCGLMDMADTIEDDWTAEEKRGARQAEAFVSALNREVQP
tara:strand:+ start:897 stop:1271 length:375 start_codon:yes stop_codon:yes gene_type:complete